MSNNPSPVSLSDEALNTVIQMCRPLVVEARAAFLEALAEELKDEPQPVGDGTIARAARALLRSGMYRRDDAFIGDDQRYGQTTMGRPSKLVLNGHNRRAK
jgi:hypothetical protein